MKLVCIGYLPLFSASRQPRSLPADLHYVINAAFQNSSPKSSLSSFPGIGSLEEKAPGKAPLENTLIFLLSMSKNTVGAVNTAKPNLHLGECITKLALKSVLLRVLRYIHQFQAWDTC